MFLEKAYIHATIYGPSDKTRKILCKNPENAYNYAYYIEKEPHEQTRKVVCVILNCISLCENIDKCPRDDTRMPCQNPGRT